MSRLQSLQYSPRKTHKCGLRMEEGWTLLIHNCVFLFIVYMYYVCLATNVDCLGICLHYCRSCVYGGGGGGVDDVDMSFATEHVMPAAECDHDLGARLLVVVSYLIDIEGWLKGMNHVGGTRACLKTTS